MVLFGINVSENMRYMKCQVSINISKPGITKGQHWHNSKWEQFIVVHGDPGHPDTFFEKV